MKRLRSIALLGAIVALGVTACDNDTGPAPGVQSISVTPQDVTVDVGGTANLSATVQTVGDASSDVNWSSGNTAVATVDGNGVVSGVAEGNTTVTATSVADPTMKASASVQVVAPEPQKITISSYRAVSNEETDNDGPVSSPDTVGTLCCEPATGTSPFTVLEVTYDVDPGNKEIDKVQMILNGEVVAEQTISSEQAAAFSHKDEDVTLSKNTLDFTGDLDGAVKTPDVPNGSVEISGKVIFADGSSKTVTQTRTTYAKNHQVFIVNHASGGNTAVDSSGDRWFGGEDMQYGITLIDHFGIGLSRVTANPAPGDTFDIGNGHGNADTLTTSPYVFATGDADNEGMFGQLQVDVEDPRDADGEAYSGTSQDIPWMVLYVENFNNSFDPGLMLLDFAAPTVSGEISVDNSDGVTEASGTQFFSSGDFTTVGSNSDPGVGIVDEDSDLYSVSRPVASPTETWSDVTGIGDLPQRMEDDSVTLTSLSDVLGNENTSTGVSTSPFGVDRTAPDITQDDSVGTATMVLRVGPDSIKNMLLFSATDPDTGGVNATAGIKLIAGGASNAFGPDVTASLINSSGTTVGSGSADNAVAACGSTFILDWDRNDDATNGDFCFDVELGVQGTGFTAEYFVPDSASEANVTTMTVGPFAIDTAAPQTTMINPPPANVASSQNSLQFSIQARTTDGVNLNDITVLVETPGADLDCTTRDDNSLVAEGSGAGEVSDNTVEVATDLDATSYEFSNDADADAGAVDLVVQNTGDGSDQSICWVVSSSDDAQDNMGNPEPWTNDRITRTDIDWQ